MSNTSREICYQCGGALREGNRDCISMDPLRYAHLHEDDCYATWHARDAEVSAQSALIRELAEALRDARKWSHWFSSEPGSKHDEVLKRIDALLARAEKEQSNGP